jgi:hypothetical protein
MNGNGSDLPVRFKRVEDFVEVLANEHIEFERELKRLLTAQVVMQDSMKAGFERLTAEMAKLAESQRLTDEKMRATDEKLNALIDIVDGIIKKPPQSS